jgi:hypothetical protein
MKNIFPILEFIWFCIPAVTVSSRNPFSVFFSITSPFLSLQIDFFWSFFNRKLEKSQFPGATGVHPILFSPQFMPLFITEFQGKSTPRRRQFSRARGGRRAGTNWQIGSWKCGVS